MHLRPLCESSRINILFSGGFQGPGWRRVRERLVQDGAGPVLDLAVAYATMLDTTRNPEQPELWELINGFGEPGLGALYRYEPDADAVYVLALRHHKEAGN